MTASETPYTSKGFYYVWYLTALAVVIAISAAGYGYIQLQKNIVLEDTRHELETVSDLKASQLTQWRRERLQEAHSIHTNPMLSHRLKDYLDGVDRKDSLKEINTWMVRLNELGGYSNIVLFRPDGKVITTASETTRHQTPHYQAIVAETIQKQAVIFTDFHHDHVNEVIDIDISIPILHRNGSESVCLAVLVIDINPFRHLYPIIRYWPTPSRTAEALLVERNSEQVRYLSQLRHQSEPPLTFKMPTTDTTMPDVRAALGQEGVYEGKDYRGVPVKAAVRTIAGSSWVIIAKVDIEEIMEPVAERTRSVVLVCLLLILMLGLAVVLGWSRKRGVYLRRLYVAERKHSTELEEAERKLQIAHDELEQRVLERTIELQKSHILLKGISQQIPGVIYQFKQTADGRYCVPYASDATHELFEFAPDDIRDDAAPLFERIHPNDVEHVIRAIQDSADRLVTWHSDFQIVLPGKGLRWVSGESRPQKQEDGSIVWHGFLSDITERKTAEQELADKRLQLSEAQRQAHIGNWSWAVDTDTITWSDQMYVITGMDPTQKKIGINELATFYTPDSWVSLDNSIRMTLKTGEPFELELEIVRRDGQHRTCIERGERVYNQFGIVIGLRGTQQDVSERIQLERRLNQARRLESIGQLAAGVAHEVRNPLNAILSISEALFKEAEIEGNPTYEPYIHHIRTQVTRLAKLMNDLLELGKPILPTSMESIHLNTLCSDTISLWNSSGSAQKIPVLLKADIDPSQIYIKANHLKLQQAIFNLLENAAQNSGKGSTISISISVPESDATEQTDAIINITDAGKGLPENIIDRIFDPFFTDRKEGTGLGLTLVKHLIENMGGTIRLFNNDPPPGCTAEIRIPQARKESA